MRYLVSLIKILVITALLTFQSPGPAMAGSETQLPEIKTPSKPETDIRDIQINWMHRHHYTGVITRFTQGKIWVKHRGFDKSPDILYFDWEGKTAFYSSFKVGMEVGLILNKDLEILEIWEVPPI